MSARRVLAKAPGKAVLLGEYAVLDGAPALSMAVNRFAQVQFEACSADECSVSAPQLGVEPVSFEPGPDGSLEWDIEAAGWPELKRTASLLSYLHSLALKRFEPAGPFRVSIDTSELFITQGGKAVKLGLGSSSAVAVALDAGLRCFVGGQDDSVLSMRALSRLLRPYRREQDGQGSGIDLATSLCGGVIGFQHIRGEVQAQSVVLPEALILRFVWSGKPASTTRLLKAYRQWQQDRPQQAGVLVEKMTAVCQAAHSAIEHGDADALVELFASYGQLMGTMGAQMGAGIVSERHALIGAEANRLGLAYKPCGAGGGDIGMVATTSPGLLHDMDRWLERNGFLPLPLTIDDRGVEATLKTPLT